jgi:hypothetical protein
MRKTEQVTSVNVMGWVAKIIAWVRTLQRNYREIKREVTLNSDLTASHAETIDKRYAEQCSLDNQFKGRINELERKAEFIVKHADTIGRHSTFVADASAAIDRLQLQVQNFEGIYNDKVAHISQLVDIAAKRFHVIEKNLSDAHHPVALPIHKRLTEMEEKIARFHEGFANQAVKIDKLESAAWKATGREEPEWRAIFDLNTKIQIRLEQAERHIAAHTEKIKDCASDFQIASLEHKTEEHDKKLAEHSQSIHAITDGKAGAGAMMRLLEVEGRCEKLESGSVSDPKGTQRFAEEIRSEVSRLAVAYEKAAEDRQANFNGLLEKATAELQEKIGHVSRAFGQQADWGRNLERRVDEIVLRIGAMGVKSVTIDTEVPHLAGRRIVDLIERRGYSSNTLYARCDDGSIWRFYDVGEMDGGRAADSPTPSPAQWREIPKIPSAG